MIKSKEILKKYLKKKMNIDDDVELELVAEALIKIMGKKTTSTKSSRIWKKEELEAQGIEVKPVKWKKLDSGS